MTGSSQLLGVFDSGVGGLSVLKAIRARMPSLPVLYVADQIHVPYGSRTLDEVRCFSAGITHFLLEKGASVVVVACNTASAAALHHLREKFLGTLFVGMEPAIKPAAESTRTGVVGVLATPATFQGELYASVVERFGTGVRILQDTCPGLVEQIEGGRRNSAETRSILAMALGPMISAGVDTLVMGCTHYPFVIPLIQDIAGPGVRVIDPAPAVARQTERLAKSLAEGNPAHGVIGEIKFLTTGSPERLADLIPDLLGEIGPVRSISWQEGRLIEARKGRN